MNMRLAKGLLKGPGWTLLLASVVAAIAVAYCAVIRQDPVVAANPRFEVGAVEFISVQRLGSCQAFVLTDTNTGERYLCVAASWGMGVCRMDGAGK